MVRGAAAFLGALQIMPGLFPFYKGKGLSIRISPWHSQLGVFPFPRCSFAGLWSPGATSQLILLTWCLSGVKARACASNCSWRKCPRTMESQCPKSAHQITPAYMRLWVTWTHETLGLGKRGWHAGKQHPASAVTLNLLHDPRLSLCLTVVFLRETRTERQQLGKAVACVSHWSLALLPVLVSYSINYPPIWKRYLPLLFYQVLPLNLQMELK